MADTRCKISSPIEISNKNSKWQRRPQQQQLIPVILPTEQIMVMVVEATNAIVNTHVDLRPKVVML